MLFRRENEKRKSKTQKKSTTWSEKGGRNGVDGRQRMKNIRTGLTPSDVPGGALISGSG